MIRAVLDANVLVSSILSRSGNPGKILQAWREDQFDLVTSRSIIDEVARVFQYPRIAKRHGRTPSEIQGFLEELRGSAILVSGRITLSVLEADPSDDRYLECAVEGEAEFIVSGDRHLLDLEEYQGIEILSPRAFMQRLKDAQRP